MKEWDLIEIKPGESYIGHFFLLASSRSGHNFIKRSIQSWTNDLDEKTRKYIDLENPDFNYIKPIISKFLDNQESLKILNIRSLLNWYSSFFYYLMMWNHPAKPRKPYIFVGKSDLIKNPKLIENPDVFVLEEGQTKDTVVSQYISFFSFEDGDSLAKRQLDIWLSIAKEFLGVTNEFPGFIGVYYDEFVKSREYRKGICNMIGGVYNESQLNIVTQAGGASTFDKNKYVSRASEMKTSERWKNWKPGHEKYLNILKKHPALDFYLNNFDVPVEEKQFIWDI